MIHIKVNLKIEETNKKLFFFLQKKWKNLLHEENNFRLFYAFWFVDGYHPNG